MGILSSLGTVVDIFTGGSGIGSLIGSALDGRSGERSQEAANQQNIALAREQMAFQERMSGSSYQRAVKDMQAAGLNPMLAYAQGGASTPSGQSTHVEPKAALGASSALSAANTTAAVQQAMSSRAALDQTVAQTAKIRSETLDQRLNSAAKVQDIERSFQAGNLDSQRQVTEAQKADQVRSETELTKTLNTIRNLELDLNAETFSADSARRKAESDITRYGVSKARAESKFYDQAGSIPKHLEMLLDLLGAGGSAKSILRDLPRGYHRRAP